MTLKHLCFTILIATTFCGCAKDKTFWAVNDPEMLWPCNGFSVKAPAGTNWYRLPANEKFPNAIAFTKREGLTIGQGFETKWLFMKSTTAFAAGTVLDEPVQDRQDKIALGAALRKHLDRYQAYTALDLKESTYEKLVGYDCLKFSGASKKQRVGEIRMDDVEGFFCLHPYIDSFGVIIAAQNSTTVHSDKVPYNSQVDHFFGSITFTPLSSAVTRTIDVTSYPVGKAPARVLSSNGRLWVVLKGENRIVEINPSDGSVIASVQAGKEPESIALAEKDLWVANSGDGTVTRINPLTKKAVAVIDVGGMPVSLTVKNGKIWVVNQTANEVVKIDPGTNSVAGRIAVGRVPVWATSGKDGIWVANSGDGTVAFIDPTYESAVRFVSTGGRPVAISVNDAGIWVADEARNSVVQIDAKSKEVLSRIAVAGKPTWMRAFDGWDVFVGLSDPAGIVRIDPARKSVFGPKIPAFGIPKSIIFVSGAIWFVDSTGETLSKVDLNPIGKPVGSSSDKAVAAQFTK